jgi:predicted aconitase
LERFLGEGLSEESRDYLHEMGAACATYGAVGLYHVENITPEAVDQGQELLVKDFKNYVIDNQVLQSHFESYPNLWMELGVKVEKCFIGCPHLSLRQLNGWAEKILQALDDHHQARLAVETILFAAPQVIKSFESDVETYQRLKDAGVLFSTACAETLFEGEVCSRDAIVTNSNKLRAYTTARFFPNEDILGILLTGEIANGR